MDIFSHPLMWLQSLRYLPTWSASTKDFGQLSKIAVAADGVASSSSSLAAAA